MVPYDHALLSVRDFGGEPEDYIEIHKYLDETKLHFSDFKHRAILHNTFGIKVCEDVFGNSIQISTGKLIPVREIARRHILQDCNCVPTVEQTLTALVAGEYEKFNNPKKSDLEWIKNRNMSKLEI